MEGLSEAKLYFVVLWVNQNYILHFISGAEPVLKHLGD